MATALDYSAGRPTAAAVKAAQHSGVVRYVGTPGRTKNITKAEYQDMDRNGVGVALVYENHAGDAAGGFAAGQAAARAARADADSIGFPRNRPIYFAVDSDQVSAAQFAAVMSYLDGATSILGIAQVGVYGEFDVVEMAVGAHARFGWQTAAWSKGKRSGKAVLYQNIGTVVVGGIASDVNNILATDWGQHNITMEVPDMDGNQDQLLREIHVELTGAATPVYPGAGYVPVRAIVKGLTDSIAALTGMVNKQSGNSAADVAAALLPGLVPVVQEALADAEGDDPNVFAKAVTDRIQAIFTQGGAQ